MSRGGTPGSDDPTPGLQRERTLLAWTRTLLALVVAAALLLRVVGPPWGRPVHVPAVGVLLVALWLFVARDVRYRRGVRRGVTSTADLGLVAACACGVGVVALVALLAG